MAGRRIYLAGPEVFLPDPHAAAAEKKRICAEHGFEGVFPLDADLDLSALAPEEAGVRISRANEELMRSSDALIANMTPFRSPSMDVGTAYEMGFARALGLPVVGYTNVVLLFADRVAKALPEGDGMAVEDFALGDNLMLDGAVIQSGFTVVRKAVAEDALFTDLAGFAECVRLLAAE